MKKQWDDGEARDLFMIRMLPDLMDKVTRVLADNLNVEKLTILAAGFANRGKPVEAAQYHRMITDWARRTCLQPGFSVLLSAGAK